MYEVLYSTEKYKTNECINEKQGFKCDFLFTCPYLHKDEKNDSTGDTKVFQCYNHKIKKNIKMVQLEIENFEKIKKMHSCAFCEKLIKKEYYLCKPCKHLICKDCFLKKVKINKKISFLFLFYINILLL